MAITNTGIVERTIVGVNESDLFLDGEATSTTTNAGIVERSIVGVNNGSELFLDSEATSTTTNTGIVERSLTGVNESDLWTEAPTDILDTGEISNMGGGSFTFTDDGVLGVSDGTSTSFLRPRLQWDSLTVGEQYRIVGTPTINSGSTNYSIKNGSTYLKNRVAVETFDITFTCDGTVLFAADGREVFNINWDLKLYGASASVNVINNTGIVERPITGVNESSNMFPNFSESTITNLSEYKPLLETFPNALVGYSLRSLSDDTVSVVRVRRDSDDAEQDFTSEEITDGTLASFTGANDGLVSVWYDQSGNANNMTEATLSNQPTLVSNGVVNLENGKPCIVFNDNILGTSITNQEGAESLFTIASDFRDGAMVALLKSTTADKILLYESSEEARLRYNGTSPNLAKAEDFLQNSYVAINDSTDFNFYKNKELVGIDTGASFVNTDNKKLNIGSRYEGNLMAEVKVQEVIYYASDLTASNTSLVENQEKYYDLGLFESKMFLVPDASGGDVGKGFTITGIFVDEVETAGKPVGEFVVYCANQGQNIQLPAGNGLPNKASIVKLLVDVNANDLSVPTMLKEIKVHEDANFGEGKSMQGICVNNDNNIAFVSSSPTSAVFVYTKDGVFVSENSISGDNPNGLAFDSINNYYLVYSSTGSLRRFDTSFNLVDTFTIATGGDQLFYNNDTNKLYLSVDPSGYKIYDSSFNEEFVSGDLDRVLAMEGIATSSKYMFIGNDGYYHENTPYDFNSIGVFRF